MRGNHDGSWSLRASANGGYVPQATPLFSNFNVHQPIRYNIQTQQQNLNFPHPQFGAAANVDVMQIENAVNKTRKSLIAAGENVSSTRVSQSVLAQVHADSWRSLGMHMHDVPSLRQLMALEGKISAFIHCFIGARRIVTLYDLEVAICRNEFVGCFDDLELGPLLQHPLVLLYFPLVSGSTGPVQITSEEIISFLDSYLNTYGMDDVKLDEFLNFVAEKKSVACKKGLGIRIQNLRMYVSFIQEAKRQEGETLKILLTKSNSWRSRIHLSSLGFASFFANKYLGYSKGEAYLILSLAYPVLLLNLETVNKSLTCLLSKAGKRAEFNSEKLLGKPHGLVVGVTIMKFVDMPPPAKRSSLNQTLNEIDSFLDIKMEIG